MKPVLEKLKKLLKEDLDNCIEINSILISKKDYALLKATQDIDLINCDIINSNLHKRTIYRYLEYIDSDNESLSAFFDDFSQFYKVSTEYNFNYKEQFEMIMEFIKFNIEKGIIDLEINIDTFDLTQVSKYEYNDVINPINIEEKIYSEHFTDLMKKSEEDLTKEEKIEKDKIQKFLESVTLEKNENDPRTISHKNIKLHYFDKINNYTQEDIKIIIESLKSLGISSKYLQVYKSILDKSIKKEESKAKKVTLKKKEKNITDEECYEILNRYYDFKNNMPKKYVFPNEMQNLAFAMKKLQYNNEQIMNLLRDIEYKNGIFNCDIKTKYLKSLDKMNFYREKYALQEFLENMESYYKELENCNPEEYVFWIEAIEEEFKKACYYLPKNYEYELQLTKKIK